MYSIPKKIDHGGTNVSMGGTQNFGNGGEQVSIPPILDNPVLTHRKKIYRLKSVHLQKGVGQYAPKNIDKSLYKKIFVSKRVPDFDCDCAKTYALISL